MYFSQKELQEKRVLHPKLSVEEQESLLKFYQNILLDFCSNFTPPMPSGVTHTALVYYKRFYVTHSVGDFHPKTILVTCVFLACKVMEFNVSLSQFVSNVKGDRQRAVNIILDNELVLMKGLDYRLGVVSPEKALNGLLLQLKRPLSAEVIAAAQMELNLVMQTDACLVFSASQLALSCLCFAGAGKEDDALDSLFNQLEKDNRLSDVREAVWTLKRAPVASGSVKSIEKKIY